MKPKFTHDCEECKFIGRLDGHDCYVHESETQVTYVKRSGDEGPDYTSRSFPRQLPKDIAALPDPRYGDWSILNRMATP